MKRIGVLLIILLLLLILLAVYSGLSSNCTTISAGQGTGGSTHVACSGTLDTLNGSQTLMFGLGTLVIGDSVSAKITLSVVSGTVNVTYQDVEGQKVTLQLTPKKPLTIEDEVQVVSGNQVQVLIDSFHGASGFQYTAEFTE